MENSALLQWLKTPAEALACAHHAVDGIARWRDAAGRGGQLSDHAGAGPVMVAGRLSRNAQRARRRLPARAASEREVFSCNSIVILRLKFARLIATVLSHCRRLGCKCCCDCVHVRDSQIGEDVI